MSRIQPGGLFEGRELVQLFSTSGGELAFVSPVLATYERRNSGSITFSVHRVPPALVASPPQATNAIGQTLDAAFPFISRTPE
jgi:hypothetical protein